MSTLCQDLPRPFRSPDDALASSQVFKAPYWVSVWRTMYAFDPVGDSELTEAHKAKVIGLLAEMWGEQIDSVCRFLILPLSELTRQFFTSSRAD